MLGQILLFSIALLLSTIQVIPFILSIPIIIKPKPESRYDCDLFVTVIIPTHNEESVIERCIKSLLAQDYPKDNLQIIVVDDASKDRTREIVNKYENQSIKLLTREIKFTKASAINYAKDYAVGEVIAVLDADTYLEPNCIKMAVKNFSDNEIGGIVTLQKPINIKQNWLTKVLSIGDFLRFFTEMVWNRYGANNFLIGDCMFIRRKILDETQWFRDEIILDDSYVSMNILFSNYKIRLEREAVVWCEQPYIFGIYLKQRRRWFRGAFQLIRFIKNNYLHKPNKKIQKTFWARSLHIFPYFVPILIMFSLAVSITAYILSYPLTITLVGFTGLVASLFLSLEPSIIYNEWRKEYSYLILWVLVGAFTMITTVPLSYFDEISNKPIVFYKRPKKGSIMF